MTEQPSAPEAWAVATTTETYVTGPSWSHDAAANSLKRIKAAGTPEQATAQAAVEAVMVLHSIRRILIWTAVIVPLVVGALWVTMIVVAGNSEPERCVSLYSC
ncbi:hypothetical protein ACQPYE_25860 [Actinosynnema sp. CA-299493]